MVDLVSKVSARRLAGLFETISMNVIEPAVIQTTESAVLDPTLVVAKVEPADLPDRPPLDPVAIKLRFQAALESS